ncbi:MAG: tetratricopeptide repeat protein, partial [Candidatus Omnitrophota bacterium]
LWLGIFGGAFLAFVSFFPSKTGWVFFGGGGVFVLLFPQLGFFLRTNRVAEHFLYLALVGLVIVAGSCAVQVISSGGLKAKQGLSALAAAALVYFSALTFYQNRVFRDPEAFYQNVIHHAPDSWTALNNLGKLLEQKGDLKQSEALLRKAVQRMPYRPESHSNLGTLLLKQGNLPSAIEEYRAAIRLWPESPELHNNLASAYRLAGKSLEAVAEYRLTLRLDPDLIESRYFLAKTYEGLGKKQLADEQYQYLQKRGIRVVVKP